MPILRDGWSERPPMVSSRQFVLRSEEGAVVGSGDLLIAENQSRRQAGDRKYRYATIENIFVDPAYRGQMLGQQIVTRLVEAARCADCYKVVLTTRYERLVTWYEAQGFSRHGTSMRLDLTG
jgi:GNAT superfamily N-acetyltransferase